MGSVNSVTLVGHLGKDPEIRVTQGGQKVANFNLATSESWKDKQTGQKQERTEWHRLVVWGAQAEIVEKYLNKGSLIYLTGKLQTRKWTDKENVERYTTEIMVDHFVMLGGKKDAQDTPDEKPAAKADEDAPFDDSIPF